MKTVVVLERNKQYSQYLSGVNIRIFEDGYAALQDMIGSPPDLAIIDGETPAIHGAEILYELHRKHGKFFPVIIITPAGDTSAGPFCAAYPKCKRGNELTYCDLHVFCLKSPPDVEYLKILTTRILKEETP